jgi:hypothetical protein
MENNGTRSRSDLARYDLKDGQLMGFHDKQ